MTELRVPSLAHMYAPLQPSLPFGPSPESLTLGRSVRVRLARDGPTLEGALRAIDARGLSLELPRPFFRTAADWAEDGEGAAPRVRRLRWGEIARLWVRARAVGRGSAWGMLLAGALGWCGHGMDQLTDGFPRAELVYVGAMLGVVVGVAIARWGHEWHEIARESLP